MYRHIFKLVSFVLLLIAIGLASEATAKVRPHASFTRTFSEKEIQMMEQKLIELINKERAKYGLQALNEWSILAYHAKVHSQNMASGAVAFSHDGIEARADVIKLYARSYSFGENVAYNYNVNDPLRTAVESWMNSEGHRQNILGDFNETGIGIVYSKKGYCYLTQLFAKRSKH